MKKYFFSALALILVASAVSAQGFTFGVKLGANLNKVSGQSFKEGYDLGYHIGAFSEIGLSKKFGIQPEVLFNQINTKRVSGFNEIYGQNNLNPNDIDLKYLSIPLLLRYNLNSFMSLNVGPQFGVLIDDKENLFDNGKKAFKDGDFSAVAGLTLNVSSLRIYGRYNIGLANVNDIDNKDKWKNQQVQLGLGLKF
jgi:opacity protein-like surface antigen